jgi:hypothetical protein
MHPLNDQTSITEESPERKNRRLHVSHYESSRVKPMTHGWHYPGCTGVAAKRVIR